MLIIIFLLSFNVSAVDLSTYEPVGEVGAVAGMSELSGGVWVDSLNGAAYVDNGTGRLEYPGSGSSCYPGGDLEAVTNYQEGRLYVVNEAKNGVSVVNTNGCVIERRFLTDIDASGSDGIEGIAVYQGVVYLLEEVTGNIYYFTDAGGTARVSPTLLFTVTNCVNAGDLTIDADGNFLIACEPPSNTVVQYDMSGNYLGSLNDPLITNPEVVYFDNLGNLWVGGEPSQLRQYSGDTIPRETESCTYSGAIDVYTDNGAVVAPQSVSLICPTATASGTIQ